MLKASITKGNVGVFNLHDYQVEIGLVVVVLFGGASINGGTVRNIPFVRSIVHVYLYKLYFIANLPFRSSLDIFADKDSLL